MIVSISIGASEKRSARSQYEPNEYSARLGIDQLVVERPEDLLTQARTLFVLAKQAISTAMRADGLEVAAPVQGEGTVPQHLGGRLNGNGYSGNGSAPIEGADHNGRGPSQAAPNGNGHPHSEPTGYNGGGRPKAVATEPQLGLIRKLARSQRLDAKALDEVCRGATGQALDGLSKFDASRVITALKGDDR